MRELWTHIATMAPADHPLNLITLDPFFERPDSRPLGLTIPRADHQTHETCILGVMFTACRQYPLVVQGLAHSRLASFHNPPRSWES